MRILNVAGSRVEFAGVDLLDGTPVLDVKPYVGRFDQPPGDPACGWFDDIAIADGVTPRPLTIRIARQPIRMEVHDMVLLDGITGRGKIYSGGW